MSVDYSIRIDFDTEVDHPERVFHAMALFVEGFNEIQEAFATGFGEEIEFSSSLDKTREGSCIADVRLKAKEAIRKVNLSKIMDGIYFGCRTKIANVEKLDSEGDFRSLADEVYSHVAANQADYESFTAHGEADLYLLASGFHKLDHGKKYLSEKDKVQFGRQNDFQDVSPKMSCPRKPDEIFEDVETPFPSKEVFVVRRPAYVEGLMWDFECENRRPKKFNAAMLDQEWFKKWKSHDVQLWPGDAIFVETRTIRKVNSVKRRKPKFEHQVLKVIKRVPSDTIEQFTLDLNDET